MRKTTLQSIMQKVSLTDSCWLWNGSVNKDNYGFVGINNKVRIVHRVVYEMMVGKIPNKMELDHLCKVRNCVNPAHLEPVTRKENCLRSDSPWAKNARKNECVRGHLLDGENMYINPNGARICRACNRIRRNANLDFYNSQRRKVYKTKMELNRVPA